MLDWIYFGELIPILLKYLPITLWLTFVATAISLALGLALALIKVFNVPIALPIANLHISFFRGTPLLVQLFLIYYGLPQIFPELKDMTAYGAAILGLSLHFSAYMAESMRGAIHSVPANQTEAALSIGMTMTQTMSRIVLPQAARSAVPALMNNFIDLLKSTSLVFTLGVTEIMAKAQQEAASSFNFFESYLAVALIYWVLISLLTALQSRFERHLNRAFA
jgi:putative amino-acid transport system permease protein